ncbi:AAA family ATPase [Streptomyces sp. NPDC047072]|uniref:caspase, EACC1-associated type n=1 Tax=Streptomyces sp. NPDC047072 TaxID=3154809 RepID=UPI003410936D
MGTLKADGTRVLLVGCGTYGEESGLDDVAAVPASVRDLGEALVERCGLSRDSLTVLVDPAEPAELGLALEREIEQAKAGAVLWFHYVGHGLVSPSGALHLATRATRARRPRSLAFTALPYASVREALLMSDASALVVTLDCCFSGRAVGTLGASSEGMGPELTRIEGGFVLTAAAREEHALAPAGAVHTAFTGELIRLLRQGSPEAGPHLTLLGASKHLRWSLGSRGLPVPRQHASGRAGELLLCPNPAYSPPTDAEADARAREADESAAAAVCPYPGLVPFGPEQAQWFFGRTALLEQLTTRLAQHMDVHEPLLVIGPSGAGKSSLLGAGLLPALDRGEVALPGCADWPHLWLTPTGRPVAALASGLARLGAGDAEETAAAVTERPDRANEFVTDVLAARAAGEHMNRARLVLVVDQFEEVFTLCEDERERRAFIRALTAAAGSSGGAPSALVIIGVRADFYAECLAQPGLRRALEQAVVVGPLTAAGMAKAITEPAQLCHLKLQPGLVELMLRDLGLDAGDDEAEEFGDPGALPLLAHALRAVWEGREGRALTLAGYRKARGVDGAIATTANACYDGLETQAQRELAQTLLLRLIQVGETTETRRRLRTAELLEDLPEPDASLVLEALTRVRLVTRGTDTVEIAHEVLFRVWPRLRTWVQDDRGGLLIRQRLSAAAAQWEASGRQESDLRQQTRLLSEEVQWAATVPAHLRPTAVEKDFLDASVALGRRRVRTRRRVRAVVGGLAVLALLAGALAWQRSQALAADRLQATARNIAARADTLRQFDPQTAMLLNVAAWETSDVPEARSGLLTASTQQDQDTFSLPDVPTAEQHLSQDAGTVVSVDSHGSGLVRVWDVATKQQTKHFNVPVESTQESWQDSALSADGSAVAVQSADGVRLWKTSTGQPASPMVGDGDSRPLALRGTTLVLAVGNHVEVWDMRTPRRLARVNQAASEAELNGTGRMALCTDGLLDSSRGGRLSLWDLRTGRRVGKDLSPSPGRAVCDEGSMRFSPDGKLLAVPVFTGQSAGVVGIWDTRTARPAAGDLQAPFVVLGPGDPFSTSVAFSPNGKVLAVADDRVITLYKVSSNSLTSLIHYSLQSEGADYLGFTPDGQTLRFLRGSDAGTAVRSLRPFAGSPRTYASPNSLGVISGDGKAVAVQSPHSERNKIQTVDGETGKPTGFVVETLHRPQSADADGITRISPMALSLDGGVLVVGDPGARTVTVWNTRLRHLERELVFSAPVNQLSFQLGGGLLLSSDGTVVAAVVGNKKTIEARSTRTGAAIRTIRGVSGQVMAISADGQLLVTDTGEIIDLGTGRRRRAVLAHYATATQAAFSPDGRFLAATDYAGGLALWNGKATKRLTYLDGGSAYAYGHGTRPRGGILAFSVDGGMLAVQHPLQPQVQLWDTRTLRHVGEPLPLSLDGEYFLATSLAFDPQEKTLRTVGGALDFLNNQGSVGRSVYYTKAPLDPATLVTGLCIRAGRDLTRAEWALYIPEISYRRVCA